MEGVLQEPPRLSEYKSYQASVGLQAALLTSPWGTSFSDKSFSLKGPAYIAGGNVKCTATQENSCSLSYKTKHTPYNPATQILGIYPRAIKMIFIQKAITEKS